MHGDYIESERTYKIIREAYKDSIRIYSDIKEFLEAEGLIPKASKETNIADRLHNMVYSGEKAIQVIDNAIRMNFGLTLNQFISEYSYETIKNRAVNEILKHTTYSSFMQRAQTDKLPFKISNDGSVILSHDSLWLLSNHAKWLLASQGVAVNIG